ncbi:MAG TPA: FecR domain-containing protein, partial [Candidatus Ozemobacteraceae bacterium]|nr:FecR domain-containing protein [Candidatus Ozemobacteraceae bacterium]
MKRHMHAILGGVLFAVTAVGFAQVDLSTTELIKVAGKVEVQKGQDPAYKAVPTNLKLAGALKRLDAGDKVKTHDQSGAEMVLKDTCILGVKEKSQFEVPSTLGAGSLAKLKAQQGSFLFKVVSGSNFKVQTSEVIAGVKGTLFGIEVTDNLAPFLKLPGLDLGLENPGGTMVNVYEGEVELNHAVTGKRRTVKAGERLAVLNRVLSGLDKSLGEGFSPIEKIDILKDLAANFGEAGLSKLRVSSKIEGLKQLGIEGYSLLTGTGDRKQQLQMIKQQLPAAAQERWSKFEQIRGAWRGLRSELQNLKGKPFVPTFDEGKYPTRPTAKLIPENGIEEAH